MTIYYRKDYDDPLSVNCGYTMHLFILYVRRNLVMKRGIVEK